MASKETLALFASDKYKELAEKIVNLAKTKAEDAVKIGNIFVRNPDQSFDVRRGTTFNVSSGLT